MSEIPSVVTPVVPVVEPKPSIGTRTKNLVKTTFTKVGVPVLIGTAAAYVVTRTRDESETIESDLSDLSE